MERGEIHAVTTGSFETPQTDFGSELTTDQSNAEIPTPASQSVDHQTFPSEQDNRSDNFSADDRAAAATALVQMQGRGQNSNTSTDTGRFRNENQNLNWAPDMTNFYNHVGQVQSTSNTEVPQQAPTQRNTAYSSNSAYSSTSGVSVRDTISNLSSTISSMQQQQAFMASALGNLTNFIQDMRNNTQSQGLNTNSTTHETVGNFSFARSGDMHQVQQSSNSRYQSDQARYENNVHHAPEQQGLRGSSISQNRINDSHDQHQLRRNNELQQYEWTHNSPLSNPNTGWQNGNNESQTSYNFAERQQQRWSDNRPLLNSRRDGYYRTQQQTVQQFNSTYLEAKLPPFNGKEDWKVWLSRFEAVARRRNWNDDAKLDNLIPRLQGRAGDFVFSQLSQETMSCYSELIKELNNRFRVVETQRTYAAKFSQRVQKPNETVEEYAAELKRLYSKAYKTRDASTRREDLVRRFLDGLKDGDARFEIEFHKEPEDIDDAVFHAVNFIQTKRRNQTDTYSDKKFKKYTRRASTRDEEYDSEVEYVAEEADVGEAERIMRLPSKDEENKKKTQKSEQKKNTCESESDSLTEVKQMLKTLAGKVEEIQRGTTVSSDQKPRTNMADKSGVICYACGERGHISRRCPKKQGGQRPRETANRPAPNQGRLEGSGQIASSLNL